MKSEWIEKFEMYLGDEMDKEEKALFEAELSSNEELKNAMELYRTIEEELLSHHSHFQEKKDLKKSLETLNKRYFSGKSATKIPKTVPLYFNHLLKTAMSIAASWIFLLVGGSTIVIGAYFAFFHISTNPRLLAENYIVSNLHTLGQTMGARDSMQLGIDAHNQKKYNEAISYFGGILETVPEQEEALKNIGISYLAIRDFESALLYFEKLDNLKHLEINEGKFLKALTLMLRDQGEDRIQAKQLLEEVLEQDAAGSKQAKEWLKKFD